MTPEQFWKLNPTEFWWLYDARRPPKMYGSLNEYQMADLYDEMKERGVIRG